MPRDVDHAASPPLQPGSRLAVAVDPVDGDGRSIRHGHIHNLVDNEPDRPLRGVDHHRLDSSAIDWPDRAAEEVVEVDQRQKAPSMADHGAVGGLLDRLLGKPLQTRNTTGRQCDT